MKDLVLICLSLQKFLEYLDIIRDKHNVPKIKWDNDLENQAKIYATRLKLNNGCKYEDRTQFSELHLQIPERLTEKEVINPI
jgi:uncharacterized protein YkwD